MPKVKKGLINPEVVGLLQSELNDLQDDLCKQCGATNVFDYAGFSGERQQGVVYVLVNSDDEIINKLRHREERLMEVLHLMGEKPKSLLEWLNDFTRK